MAVWHPGDAIEAHLVTDRDARPVHTARRECDVESALMRGLAEYLSRAQIQTDVGGRLVEFVGVYDDYPEKGDDPQYPGALIYTGGSPTKYDAGSFTPKVNPKAQIQLPDGRYLCQFADVDLELTVECWCTDNEERRAVILMVEDALTPVEWMYGARLDLPFYHGARATYSLQGKTVIHAEDTASQGIRIVKFAIQARAPLVRMFSFPQAQPKAKLGDVT